MARRDDLRTAEGWVRAIRRALRRSRVDLDEGHPGYLELGAAVAALLGAERPITKQQIGAYFTSREPPFTLACALIAAMGADVRQVSDEVLAAAQEGAPRAVRTRTAAAREVPAPEERPAPRSRRRARER